jgi:hypothetical protein
VWSTVPCGDEVEREDEQKKEKGEKMIRREFLWEFSVSSEYAEPIPDIILGDLLQTTHISLTTAG